MIARKAIETIPLDAITWNIVRADRYKGCRQAHNAQVVMCAIFHA